MKNIEPSNDGLYDSKLCRPLDDVPIIVIDSKGFEWKAKFIKKSRSKRGKYFLLDGTAIEDVVFFRFAYPPPMVFPIHSKKRIARRKSIIK